MDDRKEYSAFSIPTRGKWSENETPAPDNAGVLSPIAKTPSNRAYEFTTTTKFSGDGAQFAEIEYEAPIPRASAGEQALRFFSSIHETPGSGKAYVPPQPIKQRETDPIREKFFEMRSLASDRPFARDDAELFYKQAKFMEDFTDDFGGDARFFMYYPYYQHMGYDQLRTYFTWRTKARRGEVLPTSASYAFLYVYELLSGIGADSPADGLNKLVQIWDGFLKYGPELENYLVKWFKDYHIFYELPHGFTDFIKEHDLQKYYSLTLIFDTDAEDSFSLWNSISLYDVTQSVFYKEDGNERLIKECFRAVLSGISDYCESCGKSFDELFIYKISNRITWNPFNNALFQYNKHQPDRQVTMPGKERYYCKNGRWSANLPIYYSNHRDYAGYVLKKMESCLRQALKYKYKLTAELKVRDGYYKELAITGTELDSVIENAVGAFYRDATRTVVTVDHENLARIRKEALGTQEALIVPEDEINSQLTIRSSQLGNGDDRAGAGMPPANSQSDDGDAWTSLKGALTETELEALSMALNGDAEIKAFADKNGIMLEVLADSINGKASDFIGDSVMEINGEVSIYDEYRKSIAEMVKKT